MADVMCGHQLIFGVSRTVSLQRSDPPKKANSTQKAAKAHRSRAAIGLMEEAAAPATAWTSLGDSGAVGAV